MFLKTIFLLLLFINVGLPANQIIDIIFILAGIIVIFFSDFTNKLNIIKNKFFYLVILLTVLNLFLPKLFFHEGHSVFLSNKDLNILENFLPKNVFEDMKKDFNKKFEFERLKEASPWEYDVTEKKFIDKPFAFSADNFFHRDSLSRSNSKIKFKNREELRIGQINTLNFNWPWDTPLRRELPFYVFFEIPNYLGKSSLCYEGNIYYYQSKEILTVESLKNTNFNKVIENSCKVFDNKDQYIYLLGYSINSKDNLKLEYTSNTLTFLKFAKNLINLFIIILFFKLFTLRRSRDLNIYFLSIFSTIILTAIRDFNVILGIRYFRGGADGLVHYGYGRKILEELYNLNFLDALKGVESVYYFMPGLRYFATLNNLIFGETLFGYFIICTLIPLVFYKIFEILSSKKIALIFILSFIFIPILENMGLGYFNFIWNFVRFHAEPISILIFLMAIYLVFKFDKNKSNVDFTFSFIGLFLAISVFLRPNYFPSSLIIFLYLCFILIKQNKFKLIIYNLIGFSFISLSLVHNIVFGNEAFLFTRAIVNFKLDVLSFFNAIQALIVFDINNNNLKILFEQLSIWNPVYNFHRLLMIILILFFIIRKIQLPINYFLLGCILSQHGVLILTHAGGRYSYFAWILTFILFVKLIIEFREDRKSNA